MDRDSKITWKQGKQENKASDPDALQFKLYRRLAQAPVHLARRLSRTLADALRHDFLQVFHVFGCSIMMLHVGTFARDVSRKEGLALEYPVQNFFHTEREPVGLGEAGDFRFAIAGSQDGAELAVAVNALVVHLDRDDPLEFPENFLKTVRQRMEMTQMQRADFLAVLARRLRSVVDGAVG